MEGIKDGIFVCWKNPQVFGSENDDFQNHKNKSLRTMFARKILKNYVCPFGPFGKCVQKLLKPSKPMDFWVH